MIKRLATLFIILGIPIVTIAMPLYLVKNGTAIFLTNTSIWKGVPFVKISQIAPILNLKWSYKNKMGVVIHNGDFISFNLKNHRGTYDALYVMNDVSTNTQTPYLSIKAVAKLVGMKVAIDPAGAFLFQRLPSVSLKGVLLYGKRFTIFFNVKSPKTTIKVTSNGIVTTVKIFPVSFSKNYIQANSPLVVEKDGEISAEYRITYTGKLEISTALGYPSLPTQESSSLNFNDGIAYRSLVYKTLTGKMVYLNFLKIPPGVSHLKIVYPHSGVGTSGLLSSFATSNAVAAIGIAGKSPGFVMSNGKILSASNANCPTLVWNGKKFDIIETSPVVTVNIGPVPFKINAVNCATGDVVMYTYEYGGKIPKSNNRIYYRIEKGVIVSKKYAEHVRNPNDVILSLTNKYALFLKDVTLGNFVNFFTSLEGVNLDNIDGAIQGHYLIIYNSKKVKLWSLKETECSNEPKMVIGIKNKSLYFIRVYAKNANLDLDELSNILLNFGFSKAMCLNSGKNVSMIVDGKIVGSKSEGLYPAEFGIEIDQTTGGA